MAPLFNSHIIAIIFSLPGDFLLLQKRAKRLLYILEPPAQSATVKISTHCPPGNSRSISLELVVPSVLLLQVDPLSSKIHVDFVLSNEYVCSCCRIVLMNGASFHLSDTLNMDNFDNHVCTTEILLRQWRLFLYLNLTLSVLSN